MDATPVIRTLRSVRSFLQSPLPVGFCGLLLMGVAGCEAFHSPSHWPHFWGITPKTMLDETLAHREEWQSRRSGAAFRWLAAHELRNGLTIEEVNLAVGDTGIREENSAALKNAVPGYRVEDDFYRYGPDRDGRVYYLSFREGHLTRFHPEDFQ